MEAGEQWEESAGGCSRAWEASADERTAFYARSGAGIVWQRRSRSGVVVAFPAAKRGGPAAAAWEVLAGATQYLHDRLGVQVARIDLGSQEWIRPLICVPALPERPLSPALSDVLSSALADLFGTNCFPGTVSASLFHSARAGHPPVLAVAGCDISGRGGWTSLNVKPQAILRRSGDGVAAGAPEQEIGTPARAPGNLPSITPGTTPGASVIDRPNGPLVDSELLSVDTVELPTLTGRWRAHQLRRGWNYLLRG